MTVLAGPVFTEWYWGPLFAVLLFGPPVSVLAAVLYLVLRRRLPGGRVARGAAAYALSALLIVGGWAVVRAYRFEKQEEREARGLGFTLYQPRDGFRRDPRRGLQRDQGEHALDAGARGHVLLRHPGRARQRRPRTAALRDRRGAT